MSILTIIGVLVFFVVLFLISQHRDEIFSKNKRHEISQEKNKDVAYVPENVLAPYFELTNLAPGARLNPVNFGRAVVKWGYDAANNTFNMLMDGKTWDFEKDSKFISDMKLSPIKIKLLIISLEVSAYYVYVTRNLSTPTEVLDNFIIGIKDGFQDINNGEFVKILNDYFMFFTNSFNNELNSNAEILPGQLTFGGRTLLNFEKALRKFHQVDEKEWDMDILSMLEFMRAVSFMHGTIFLTQRLPEFGLKIVL